MCFCLLIKKLKPKKSKKIYYQIGKFFCGNLGFIFAHQPKGIIINIGKVNLKNFSIYFNNKILGYTKGNSNFKTKIFNGKISISCANLSQICVVAYAFINATNYKVGSFGINQKQNKFCFNCHCKTRIENGRVKIIKVTKAKNLNLTLINNFSTMQNTRKTQNKAKFKIINAKQFSVDLSNNVVKIPNKKFDVSLINQKISSIKKWGENIVINNTYFVRDFGESVYVSLKPLSNNFCFNSKIKPFFNIKIFVPKNCKSQTSLLEQQILNEYLLSFTFEPFFSWLNKNKINPNSKVFCYFNLLKTFGILELTPLGVKLVNPSFLCRQAIIFIDNNKLMVLNENGKYCVLYNGIKYYNINYLTLNNNKTFEKNIIV